MKESIYDLVIEVTRRCNMSCNHCSRGEAESIDIPDEYLEAALSKISYISNLTITGGEPSLVPNKIIKIVELIKKYEIEVYSIYMVTNAKEVSDDFLLAILKLYSLVDYIEEEGVSGLAYSNSSFHEDVNEENIRKLKLFSFTTPKYSEKSTRSAIWEGIIPEGRGFDFCNYDRAINYNQPYEIEVYNDVSEIREGMIYLNCKGNILPQCDMSYESQEIPELIMGNIMDEGDDFSFVNLALRYNLWVESFEEELTRDTILSLREQEEESYAHTG